MLHFLDAYAFIVLFLSLTISPTQTCQPYLSLSMLSKSVQTHLHLYGLNQTYLNPTTTYPDLSKPNVITSKLVSLFLPLYGVIIQILKVSGKTHLHSSEDTCTISIYYYNWTNFECRKNSFWKCWKYQERYFHIQVFTLKLTFSIDHILKILKVSWKTHSHSSEDTYTSIAMLSPYPSWNWAELALLSL